MYGYNLTLQHSVRAFVGGRLKPGPDTIADNRLGRATEAKALLILFNREHNFIAGYDQFKICTWFDWSAVYLAVLFYIWTHICSI